MAEKDAKLQDIEDVEIEDLQTEDEEPVSSVYVLAGKAFSIAKDSQKTIDMLSEQLREALPDTGQRVTDMGRIVDRVQTLMSTNFRDIRRPSKLKEKAKSLRTNLRRRITDLSKKILPKLEEIDPPPAEVGAKIEALNEATIELQRLLTDEAALTLILRRDMTDDDTVVDVARRKDRVEVANSLIQQARVWVKEYGPGESNPGGKLLVLGSADVAEVDEVYDTSVAKIDEVEEQQGQLPSSVVKEPSPRSVSPEPSKRPAFTSTPYQPDFQPMSPQTAPRVARKVSFGEPTNLGRRSTEQGGARRYPDTPAVNLHTGIMKKSTIGTRTRVKRICRCFLKISQDLDLDLRSISRLMTSLSNPRHILKMITHLHRLSRTSQITSLSNINNHPPMRRFQSSTGTTPSGVPFGRHSRSSSTRIPRYPLFQS